MFLPIASISGFLTSPGISFPTRVIDRLIIIEMQPSRIKSRGNFFIAKAVSINAKGKAGSRYLGPTVEPPYHG
jgi:hypothetical protein